MSKKLYLLTSSVLLITLANTAFAYSPGPPDPNWPDQNDYRIVRSAPPVIDGIISPGEWDKAEWIEMDDVYDMHPRFMIEAHNKVVDPPGEAKSNMWIFNEIGRRVVPEHWFENEEACLDYQVRRGKDMTWKKFSEQLVSGCWGKDQVYYKYKTDYWVKGGGFPTPTGKFEFASKKLEEMGYDPLPQYREPGESPLSTPELFKEYPVVMTSGFRQPFYFLGQYRNIPWLRGFMEYPTCQLHPETAEKYGIVDGDWVWIESPRGRIRQKARVFPGILRGVLMATANCFYPEEPPETYHGLFISNPNILTNNNHLDPMYGSPDLTCLLCKVYPCTEEDLQENVFKTEAYGTLQRTGEGTTALDS